MSYREDKQEMLETRSHSIWIKFISMLIDDLINCFWRFPEKGYQHSKVSNSLSLWFPKSYVKHIFVRFKLKVMLLRSSLHKASDTQVLYFDWFTDFLDFTTYIIFYHNSYVMFLQSILAIVENILCLTQKIWKLVVYHLHLGMNWGYYYW